MKHSILILSIWKIPFLIIIAILGWLVLFPSHWDDLLEFREARMFQRQDPGQIKEFTQPDPPGPLDENQIQAAKELADRFPAELLDQMDNQWEDVMSGKSRGPYGPWTVLRQSPTGWRVERQVPNLSLFARTGLHQGDEISAEAMRALKQMNPALADRILVQINLHLGVKPIKKSSSR